MNWKREAIDKLKNYEAHRDTQEALKARVEKHRTGEVKVWQGTNIQGTATAAASGLNRATGTLSG